MQRVQAPNIMPFKLDHNSAELAKLFGMRSEHEVASIVAYYTISSDGVQSTTRVEQGKYKSALFLLYLQTLSKKPLGDRFERTVEMLNHLHIHFEPAMVDDALKDETKHPTLRALLGQNVTIQLTETPAN